MRNNATILILDGEERSPLSLGDQELFFGKDKKIELMAKLSRSSIWCAREELCAQVYSEKKAWSF